MPIGIYYLVTIAARWRKTRHARRRLRSQPRGRNRSATRLSRAGPCADDTELLLKSVVAIAGDEVAVTPAGVTVNDCLLPQPACSAGPVRTPTGSVAKWALPLGRGPSWLYAADDRSWDSRYWGPAAATSVADSAYPVLVLPGRSARRRACRTALPADLRCSGNPGTGHHLLSFDIILTDAVFSWAWNRSG